MRPLVFAIVILAAAVSILSGLTLAPSHEASAANDQVPTDYRLIVDTANINAPINSFQMTSYDLPPPADDIHPLAYDMTALKGSLGGDFHSGNLVIAGERTCSKCGSSRPVFSNIDKISVGDTAFVVTLDGDSVGYRAVASESVPPKADWNVLLASDAADMSLLGCRPLADGTIEYLLVTFVKT